MAEWHSLITSAQLAFVMQILWKLLLRRSCFEACVIDMQMEEDFIMANPEWVKELEIMTKTKVKAEIQALSSFGFQYLSEVYLPLKLQEGDWI